jgi:glycosyltransferase involved in cell wall biosynthesis
MGIIGIDGDTLAKGTRFGDERYLRNLLRGLSLVDSENEYFLYVDKRAGKEAEALAQPFRKGCRVRSVGPPRLWLKVPITLPYWVKRDGCDLFHTQYFAPPWCPCPAVVTIHDVAFMRYPEFFSWAEAKIFRRLIRLAAAKASLILTDSEFSKREIHQHFRVSLDRIRVIPLAVDPCFSVRDKKSALDRVRRKYRIPFDRFILFVGTIQPRKNVSRLLEAFARLRAEVELEHGLVLVGPGKYRSYDVEQFCEKLGLVSHVVHTGYVPAEELVDFYNAAELFVFPSLYEGFGFPPLEAMACGLPVAASQIGTLEEVLGKGAALFDPREPQSIAATMQDLLENEQRREALRQAGLAQAKAYSWEVTARKTLSAYEEVLSRQWA